MVLLLGGCGYLGSAFARAFQRLGIPHVAPTHAELDARDPARVQSLVRGIRPRYAVNAIGFTGRPDVDGTERERLRCLEANLVVPGVLAEVFAAEGVRWGHLSSGCIYDGAKADGTPYREEDRAEFAWCSPNAGWYARTKAMAETLLESAPDCLIWRVRIPFDEFDGPRNYLSKILRYPKLLEVRGSISHRGELAEAAIMSLERGLPSGITNLTNPGLIATSEIVEALTRHGLTDGSFEWFRDKEEFLSAPGRVYRANCALSCEKALAAGLRLTEVHEAVERALAGWVAAA